jgi:hypothetical protein
MVAGVPSPSVIVLVAAVIAIAYDRRMTLSKQELEGFVAAPLKDRERFASVLRARPPELSVDALVLALLGLIGDSFVFGRYCKRLPAWLIRPLLDEPLPPRMPPQLEEPRRKYVVRNLIFLKQAVPRALDDAALEAAWLAGLQALLDLQTTYAWGSRQRRAKITGVARAPQLLEGVQAAAVAVDSAAALGADFLAVLAADGSEASADALLPHFHRAITDGSGLDLLQRLRTHAAATPANQSMLATVAARLGERNATSPALALAARFGLDKPRELWFTVRFASSQQHSQVEPRFSGHVAVDSRSQRWLRVDIVGPVSERRRTSFDNQQLWSDTLQLGIGTLDNLPDYLARAAEQLGVTWSWDEAHVFRASLRGEKRGATISWLRGSRR